jgi:hypothetical protein
MEAPKDQKLKDFAKLVADIIKSDRYVMVACDGETGEGKTRFTSALAEEVSPLLKTPFSYEDNMTYGREEMLTWIDGDKDGKNQKPEYSIILADELIDMFFSRNWYDYKQIAGVQLLSKCRDRHLAIFGNIPNFWDLDKAVHPHIKFWVHIDKRGIAWVMTKDMNPWSRDKWQRAFNEKKFQKDKHPRNCKGFLCEIRYDDWNKEDKARYYAIRNVKRKQSQTLRDREEKFRDIKEQRDVLIRHMFKANPKLMNKDMHDLIGTLSAEAIRLIRVGEL